MALPTKTPATKAALFIGLRWHSLQRSPDKALFFWREVCGTKFRVTDATVLPFDILKCKRLFPSNCTAATPYCKLLLRGEAVNGTSIETNTGVILNIFKLRMS